MTDRLSDAVIAEAARLLDMTPDRVRFVLDTAPRLTEVMERLTRRSRIEPLPDAERRTLEAITDGVIDEDIFSAGVVRMLWACWDLDKRVRAANGDADE